MSDLTSLINETRIPGLARELFYLLSGFLFLLILNFLFKPDPDMYPNFYLFKETMFSVTLFTLSYFLSRACKEVGDLSVNILLFLLQSNKIMKIKSYFLSLENFIDGKEVTVTKHRSLLYDVKKFISENPALHFENQRSIQHIILVETFSGFFVILTLAYSFWMLLPSLICVFYAIHLHIRQFEAYIEAGKHYQAVSKEPAE